MADEFEELVGLEEEELEEEELEEESTPEADTQEGGSGGDDTVPFVHLHVHSHYSLLDGAGKIDALVNRAKSLGMTALALTDHGNMYGILEFYQRCRDAGIKPILGFEAYIAPKSRTDRSTPPRESFYHLTLLAMNKEGFYNLLYLTSQAFIDGFYYRPRIDKELLRTHSAGLICLSGCVSGELSQIIRNGNASPESIARAKEVARWYKELFGDRYYIELQDHGLEIQRLVFAPLIKIAEELDIPTVVTNDVHYVLREDADAQDILLCINMGKFRSDPQRMRMESDLFYLRSGREMLEAMPDCAEAIANSNRIADRCEVELVLGERFFPNFTPPDGKSSDDYLREVCLAGLKRRYEGVEHRCKDGVLSDEVMARLDRELATIKKLGFANYFLIVWDFVRIAEERGIQRTARGSGVGALVCYALNLSHVCPLDFDLLFERFLDENRTEAPDIDIDFDQDRREEIIDYVREKYGASNVAQIGTYGTMAAKMAIRDVGRALGMPIPQVNSLTALVPNGPKVTLAKAFKENPELTKVCESDRDVGELFDFARKVEGLARSAGTHACAVVISPKPLTEFLPLHRVQGKGDPITQWQGPEVERAGLLKMDFLGLRNLTILSNTLDMIEQATGKRIDPYRLPLDDKPTFELLCRGETKGVFQLESEGMRMLLAKMKPDNFRDIIASLALYRPGPLEGGMVDDYIDVKHGRKKPKYAHPVMEDVLAETNGVMVYQEQIMRILNRLGKIPLAASYTVIKAISKKKQEKIEKNREEFVKGAQENGLSEEKAREIFALIEKFAGYGFNKSHSTAYARITYITAYLKAHYPAEFMAALLNGDISNRNFTKKDKTVEHLDDCKRMGIEVLPPDINQGFANYRILDGKITFGLTAIKGCGAEAINEMVRVREEGGPYRNLFDYFARNEGAAAARSLIESLIKAGALDSFGARRSQLTASIDKALKVGQAQARDRMVGQMNLFEEMDDEPEEDPTAAALEGLPDIPEWDDREKAGNEKEVLGFYVSTHPLAKTEEQIRPFITHSCGAASRLPDRTAVIVGGMISGLEVATTKRAREGYPSQYARFTLEDTDSPIQAIIWPEQFQNRRDLIVPDGVIVAAGRIDRSRSKADDDGMLIIDQVYTTDEARTQMMREISITLNENGGRSALGTLYDILKTYRAPDNSGTAVSLRIRFEDGQIGLFTIPRFSVYYSQELHDRVVQSFGDSSLRIICSHPQRRAAPSRGNWRQQ
ncbi:MAG: DNA polymerase III subunit alpha [Thermoguttaceae bacterium]|nr:DNA polymerase III subunit alpha [Thermoguttaceae bacterium]